MILLDTNVISEPLRKLPSADVIAWMDAQIIETLYLSSVSVAEIRFGIAIMPAGARRDQLYQRFESSVMPLFLGRVLSFDLMATQAYADLIYKTSTQGYTMGLSDGYIAAIAQANKMIIATRDEIPFKAAGLTLINPWKM